MIVHVIGKKDGIEATNWPDFRMKLRVQITNPEDYLTTDGTTVTSYIQDGEARRYFAK